MGEYKLICHDDIVYSIKEAIKSATIISNRSKKTDIIFPSYIEYESKKYIVNAIDMFFCHQSNIKSIDFSPDSEIKAFVCNVDLSNPSSIEKITIPSSVTFISYNWCKNLPKLTNILIKPKNPKYCCFDEKMIIGKSSIECETYDCLVFCARDIKKVRLPNFIEYILPYALQDCKQLQNFEISDESNLQEIGGFAFSNSSINCIKIPSKVRVINGYAFCCSSLQRIEISNESSLPMIGKQSFYGSSLRCFSIPPNVTQIHYDAFRFCRNLQIIEISEKSKMKYFELLTSNYRVYFKVQIQHVIKFRRERLLFVKILYH